MPLAKGTSVGYKARLCPKKVGKLLVLSPNGREAFDNQIRPYTATSVDEHDWRYLEFLDSEGKVEAHCYLHVCGSAGGETLERQSALRCAGPLGLDVVCAGANEDRMGNMMRPAEISQGHCSRCQQTYVLS